jgi:copper oxidase (laccase) domain-containing protein
VVQALDRCGVSQARVVRMCTHDHPQALYSYRRAGRAGRHAGLIALVGER